MATLDKTFQRDGNRDDQLRHGGRGLRGGGLSETREFSYPSEYEGDIVAAGGSGNNDGNNAVTLARYRPDGSLDTTFGTRQGKVVTPNFLGTAAHVAIQSDGKILVGGSAREFKDESGNYLDGFMVARYNFDGTVDTSLRHERNHRDTDPERNAYSAMAASMAVQARRQDRAGGLRP